MGFGLSEAQCNIFLEAMNSLSLLLLIGAIHFRTKVLGSPFGPVHGI